MAESRPDGGQRATDAGRLGGAEAGAGQRPRALGTRALRGGGRQHRRLGGRRRLGAEDLLLGAALEQRLELVLLDRLALDEDLGEERQRLAAALQDLLGLDVRGLDDAPDLVVDL